MKVLAQRKQVAKKPKSLKQARIANKEADHSLD